MDKIWFLPLVVCKFYGQNLIYTIYNKPVCFGFSQKTYRLIPFIPISLSLFLLVKLHYSRFLVRKLFTQCDNTVVV